MNRDIKLIILATFLWGAGESLFYTIQPLYIEQLGANPAQIGGLLSATWLVAGLTYLPAGLLGDRLPRKPLLLGGWLIGLTSALVCALARDWHGLIPGLVMYGFSTYCIPVVNAYMATAAEGRNLEKIFTTGSAVYTIGALICPALGGLLAEQVSMRAVYIAAAGFFALSTGVVAVISPQRPRPAASVGDGWRLLFSRRVLGFAVPLIVFFFALDLTFPLTPNFLADVRGLSTAQVGALGSVYALGTTLISLAFGRLGGRIGLLLGGSSVWLSALLLLGLPGVTGAGVAFFLRGAYWACRALTQAQVGNLLGAEQRGLMMGAAETILTVAMGLAPIVAGRLYQVQPTWPFIGALILIPLAMPLVIRLSGGSEM